jgi:Amidohydrolase family
MRPGGRVAVHCQTAQGYANAVAAGADSLEHGMHLDPGLLDQTAAQGTTLVPTIGAFAQAAVRVRAQPPGPRRDAFLRGWATLPTIARAAYEAGVTVLTGTDTHPCGTVAEEVERLISAGLPRAAALGAACWTARAWLGLPGLADGAPADLVVFAEDPVAHPDVLHHPSRIIPARPGIGLTAQPSGRDAEWTAERQIMANWRRTTARGAGAIPAQWKFPQISRKEPCNLHGHSLYSCWDQRSPQNWVGVACLDIHRCESVIPATPLGYAWLNDK